MKLSVCQAYGITSLQSAKKVGSLDVDQIYMANSDLVKKQTQFHHSLKFNHLKDTKSGQPTQEQFIHFSRHAKVKSFHVDGTILTNSSSKIAKKNLFFRQEKRRSRVVLHSALQEPAPAQFSLEVIHHQTHQTNEYEFCHFFN